MNLSTSHTTLPFTAIIGQEQMKLALTLNAINPRIGGVLIRGEKGTAKSTAVRALADVLPEIPIVPGCPFSCDPSDINNLCPACVARLSSNEGPNSSDTARRHVRVVTLPLGATEDRVLGTLDLKRAIKEGIAALDPGILATAHRGILYIDEVNLLDDHVVDILLDAAAMGVNTIEREGISVSHPAKFILVGTMNPEEGELRPQLLDRFGLMVTVEGIADPEGRMAVIAAAEGWDADPDKTEANHTDKLNDLRMAIIEAQQNLPGVRIDEELVRKVVDACITLGITTHRAEITVVRTARTIAALRGRTDVLPVDIREAMALALPHRMRKKPFEEPKVDQEILDDMIPDPEDPEDPDDSQEENEGEPPEGDDGQEEDDTDQGDGVSPPPKSMSMPHRIGERVTTAPVWDEQKSDRDLRKTARGRRISTPTTDPRGRRTTTSPTPEWRGLALDATLRAAAPHQQDREPNGCAVVVHDEDLRQSRRSGKAEVACVFIVDASGSMGAKERMEAAKGAILSLLEDAYVNRDRVGLVAFRGDSADVLLPLSRSPDLAYRQLTDLPTGGRTPLASGLMKGMELLQRERTKKREILPMMMLISDGRANVGSGSIREELKTISGAIARSGIRTVVIDTEAVSSRQPLALGYCREIAGISGGSYYSLSELSAGAVEEIARHEGGFSIGS
ncbi:MAG: magnesium chelatase subunit D family protein [Methanocalculus sp.]|uniref:magnesium chelatase subunit D family protein n=1 Tax=Methanocalculus sp. TaxID=2004547 RepID=UPI00271CC581|nr:magnesium chelatase subunit D family protein [Methanocalculus sp.]MDO9540215.1 magnesium chelatase subunit D family protein [Methanocalculus sp.]